MNFDQAFAFVVGEEGGLSTDRNDPGNWTMGGVGRGIFLGTKYGISAAAYPNEDIPNLTLDRAKFLYKRDYWDKVYGDALPALVSLGLFDAAVNEGVTESIRLAQTALGLIADGVFGHETMSRLSVVDRRIFARSFAIARILRYSKDSKWTTDGKSWTGRVLDVHSQMIM
ncbi:MAG: glycosyl hydrolase 108 family protein [Candidatus Binatia bacterium]